MLGNLSNSDSEITRLIQFHLNEIGLQSLGVIRLRDGEFVTIVFFTLLYGFSMGMFGRFYWDAAA